MNTLKTFAIFVLLAVCLIASSSTIYAAESTPINDTKTVEMQAPAPSQGLLMGGLEQIGLADLFGKFGIKMFGYVQGGYMYDTTAPQPYAGPTLLTFNNLRNTPIVDKISLNAERAVDPAHREFDLGFRLEGIWGYDARFIHSNGLGDTQTGRYQLDPLQMYVDVALPYLPAKIRAGKWLTISGFEHFSANIYNAFGDPSRALYSNSYQFFYAEPGTQSGMLGTYVIDRKLTAELGFTRGWNQSTRDGNSPYFDIVGRLTYLPDDKTTFVFVFTEGPEFPIGVGRTLPEGDKAHWWTYLNLAATRKIDDKLSLGICVDFVTAPGIPGYPEGSKKWGGIAGYASYAINRFATLNSRLEWYNDSSCGYSTGAATGANYFETTLGVAIKPFPDGKILSQVLIRPEIRYDGSDQRVFATGDNRSGEKGELTLSGDVLFIF